VQHDNALGNGETQSGVRASAVLVVGAMKSPEDIVYLGWIDAGTIVLDREYYLGSISVAFIV